MDAENSSRWSNPNELAGFRRDIEYTEQGVDRFLKRNVDLTIESVKRVGGGTDAATFLVNKQWIFKFICRKQAIALATAESYVLAKLSDERFPIALPRIVYQGLYHDQWPYRWRRSQHKCTARRAWLLFQHQLISLNVC